MSHAVGLAAVCKLYICFANSNFILTVIVGKVHFERVEEKKCFNQFKISAGQTEDYLFILSWQLV